MAFATGLLSDPKKVGSGELVGKFHAIIGSSTFEDGLLAGRFAKLDTGSIDNFDGSASPVVAGVVKRNVAMEVEGSSAIDSDLYSQISYVRQGFVTVGVKADETPAVLGRVYISNAGDDDDGLATATDTDVDANAEFIAEVATGVWVIYVTPAPGDLATHIADAVGAHAASAISLLDSDGYTDVIEVEAAIAELYEADAAQNLLIPSVIADPGDGGAIPVTRSGNVAITTTGVDDTRTLAIPSFAGQRLVLSLDVDAGDAVITVAAAYNQTGNTILTMADAGDAVELVAVQVAGALVWRLAYNDGAALS